MHVQLERLRRQHRGPGCLADTSCSLHLTKEESTMATPNSQQRANWFTDWFRRNRRSGGHQHYRWSVKTASDPEARRIPAGSPTRTSIDGLIQEVVPAGLVGANGQPPGPGRQPGVESTVYSLAAWLLRYHPETDGD